ncbi:MAG: hypothetical protein V3U84_05750 [Thiotrichaceae bacterium]
MMRLLLTWMMMIFMTLGPVSSLAAQINQANSSQQASAQLLKQQAQQVAKVVVTEVAEENTTQHSCCQDDCKCSFQNECDIQQLSFFAIPQHAYIPSRIVKSLSASSYLAEKIITAVNTIYRPPIIFL